MSARSQANVRPCWFNTTSTPKKFRRFYTLLTVVSIIIITTGVSFFRMELLMHKINATANTHIFALHSAEQRKKEFSKPFIYLTQTKHCLPLVKMSEDQIGDPKTCNCHVVVLSYRRKCQEANTPSHISYLFDNTTSWASGRNVLYSEAMKRQPGYHYYIFIDDDTILSFNEYTAPEMKTLQPLRAFEEWLLDFEPALGVVNYNRINAAKGFERRRTLCNITENRTSTFVIPTVWFDGCINAYHYKAVTHILPYPMLNRGKSWYIPNKKIMSAVELKFPGQAMMLVPVTIENLSHSRYPNGNQEMKEYWREFIEKIRQEAPLVHRNHSLWEEFKQNLRAYMDTSPSHCVNVTRHHPIVPFAHFEHAVS